MKNTLMLCAAVLAAGMSATNAAACELCDMAADGNFASLERALADGADPQAVDELGFNALHHAAYNGNIDEAQLLIDVGVGVNSRQTPGGNTPLMLAMHAESDKMAGHLLRLGADSDAVNADKDTALLIAAAEGKTDNAAMLLQGPFDPEEEREYFPPDVNYQDANGRTAAILAAQGDHWFIIFGLDAFNANLDVIDHSGKTALIWALENEREKAADSLVSLGANVHLMGPDGATPLDLAAINGYAELAEKIQERGGVCSKTC